MMKKFPVILAMLIVMAAVSSVEAGDISAFSLKGAKVYKASVELEGDLIGANKVPSEIEGPVRFWSALGPQWSDEVKEDECGVYFFNSEGVCLTFLPMDSEYDAQDVYFSPDGERFVITGGSPMRPDMTYAVYGEDMEKLAEIAGIRGNLEWVDPVRFVMTRIDDTRDMPTFNLSYGWRVSVVMYDTAMREEIVIKEATDTQNFWFGGVIEDGSAVKIVEQSVKSEEDWSDEEKIENRDIRVEIPAAG